MPRFAQFRYGVTVSAVLCCLFLFVSSSSAQYKIEMKACAEIKIAKAQIGAAIIETATCVGPLKSFSPKGTLRNVNLVATFPAVPTGAGITFIVTKNNADGEHVQYVDYTATKYHTSAYAQLTINTPGKYFARMVNFYDKSQVWATFEFAVGEDTVGARSVGNTAAGKGRVSVCKEIDDNWKCVAESSTWAANQYFNVLFENPTPVGVDFIGIIFHKQDASGKDIAFINEFQQQMNEKDRKYATVGDNFRLPVGTYSIYIIPWGKRESLIHNGNLTEYFAKMTLTVK